MTKKKQRSWELGLGPVQLKPGEKRLIDVQPKLLFRAEKIMSGDHNADLHLSKLFVGKEETLKLNGDTINLARTEIELESQLWSQPEYPISVEIENRGKNERTVWLGIFGQARLQ
jgi:hypothetical protein